MALFFGRLHPLLVHLPIGLILLLAILELLARSPRFKHANANSGLILALVVPASMVAVLCGWLLSLGGGYQDRLLQLHKWTGIGTAAACALAGLLYSLDLKKAYRFCLFASVGVLMVASHFGGSLTHGSDYLTKYAPGPLRRWLGGAPATAPTIAVAKTRDVANLQAFNDVIQPLLQKDCVSCHGPEKSKGKLRLDSLAGVLKGGDSGPAILASKTADSPLLKRVRLPAGNEDHMPPDGKPQPDSDEISLLEWWIGAGAPGDKKMVELKVPPPIRRILDTRFGPTPIVAKVTPPKPLKEILPEAANLGDALKIVITPLSPNDPWLQCNASMLGTNFSDAELQRLLPLGANLRWLDVAGTRVTDAGLAYLAAMPNLQRLHLERTGVSDAGLVRLTGLGQLQYLDLYGTRVTDVGLGTLERLPQLKQLYVWETAVTPVAADAFVDARTDKSQVQRWQDQIEQLQSQIRDSRVAVELGTATVPAAQASATPINTQCPVSGKPIDGSKTTVYEGSVVAFCCDDCKAEFEKAPARFQAKLGKLMPKDSTTTK